MGAGAGEGNRTLVVSLEGFCSTIELHPHEPTQKPRRYIPKGGGGGRIRTFEDRSRQIYSLVRLTAPQPLRGR